MIQQQQSLVLSPYAALYDIVVPKDNMLRQINELVDFTFIFEELQTKYCLDNGRNAIDPIRMFKYLLLKAIFELSDVDIVERSKYDLSFKYFLGMAPEDPVIDPSSLTKFRKLRLKDINLLDMLIGKTVDLAIELKILKSNSIIVDATHTKARYNQKSPLEILRDRARKLRKSVYTMDESLKAKMPAKNTSDVLEDEIEYCQKLVTFIELESGCENPVHLGKECFFFRVCAVQIQARTCVLCSLERENTFLVWRYEANYGGRRGFPLKCHHLKRFGKFHEVMLRSMFILLRNPSICWRFQSKTAATREML
ncbi:transposase IS4 family protein [Paenibacillus mucilaginosus KNP414]|uniref:Transposase IS4 family protein n=1 Tax=Paenibacillus mucilaginosus (strain KNP414) TaxID=1036673 RepID=F8FED3_PAEMK|nr:transposase IS4 family protein [Paenibacillus mucilaginosus KNP414]